MLSRSLFPSLFSPMDVPLYLFRLYLPFDAVVLSSELSLCVYWSTRQLQHQTAPFLWDPRGLRNCLACATLCRSRLPASLRGSRTETTSGQLFETRYVHCTVPRTRTDLLPVPRGREGISKGNRFHPCEARRPTSPVQDQRDDPAEAFQIAR